MKKNFFSAVFALVVIFAFGLSACSSIQSGARQGARDGVSQGIAGLFRGGNSGGSSSGSSGGSSGGSTGGSSGGTSSAPQRDYSGNSQTVPWPSDSTWSRYGLAGLQQPPGTDVTGAMMYQGIYIVSLINGGVSAFNNLVAQIERTGATLTTELNTSDGKMSGYQTSAGYINVTVDLLNGDIAIQMSQQQMWF